MTRILTAISLGGMLMLSALALDAQSPAPQTPARPQTPAPSADPYAANAAPGAAEFPLAAPAGTDSRARDTAPAGATNTGRFDAATWKYGTAFDPPAGTKVWNPVKLKMLAGGKVTGGTLFGATDPSVYCAMANAGYDFIWTEMQHDQRDWQAAARMWRTCPLRQGGAGRARRLHRRARNPARARCRGAGAGRAHGRHRRRSAGGRELGLLPAARPQEQRRRAGLRRRDVRRRARAATAPPSTTTSWSS